MFYTSDHPSSLNLNTEKENSPCWPRPAPGTFRHEAPPGEDQIRKTWRRTPLLSGPWSAPAKGSPIRGWCPHPRGTRRRQKASGVRQRRLSCPSKSEAGPGEPSPGSGSRRPTAAELPGTSTGPAALAAAGRRFAPPVAVAEQLPVKKEGRRWLGVRPRAQHT